MQKNDAFFAAPDLGEALTAGAPERDPALAGTSPREADIGAAGFFITADLEGRPQEIGPAAVMTDSGADDGLPVQTVMTDAMRREMSALLTAEVSGPSIRRSVMEGVKERVIVRFMAPGRNISRDIEIPLDITANDLVVGLNQAYGLGIDTSDFRQCYLVCENPIALLRGKNLLGEYGIRDGSLITCLR